jgi:hypothetical protein
MIDQWKYPRMYSHEGVRAGQPRHLLVRNEDANKRHHHTSARPMRPDVDTVTLRC